MSTPLISVVVPVYNVEDYLSDCLDSVLAQSEGDFEVIAVNDGSEDESRAILSGYAELDRRVRIVDQENRGLAAARNTGVSVARGEYLAFVDSDDLVAPDYLSRMLVNARRFNADVSVCGRAIYVDGAASHQERPGFAGRGLSAVEAVRALDSYRSFDMSMCGKLFARYLFEGIEFPEGKNSEDQFVCYRVLLKSSRVYYEDAPLYFYRHRPGSISRSLRVNTYPIEASSEQLAFVQERYPELVVAAKASCFFSRVAVFNAFAVRGCEIPDVLRESIEHETRAYLDAVIRNQDLAVKKKLQAVAFCFARPLYRKIYLFSRG